MTEEERQQTIRLKLARMQERARPAEAFFSSGFQALDLALGAGFPRGHMVEFFGPAGCGKTTLAMQTIAHVQAHSLTAAWIDVDHTFDAAYAARLGVDLSHLPLAQPEYAEQAFEIVRALAASDAVDLVIVDSAAALVSRLELETGMANSTPGLQSRVLASGLRKVENALARSGACVVFLNQARSRPEGEGETSAGGPPLKLYAAVRLALTPVGGVRLCLRVLKNKLGANTGESGGSTGETTRQGTSEPELTWEKGVGFVKTP
jgi:recombination protein RecA